MFNKTYELFIFGMNFANGFLSGNNNARKADRNIKEKTTMLVKDALQNQTMCTPDTNLQEVVQIMNQNNLYMIPVVESLVHKNPIGVVTEKSICRRSIAEGLNPLKLNAGRVMNGNYKTISPDADLESCRLIMQSSKIRYLVVTDDNNVCRGLITYDEIERLLNRRQAVLPCNNIAVQSEPITFYDRIF